MLECEIGSRHTLPSPARAIRHPNPARIGSGFPQEAPPKQGPACCQDGGAYYGTDNTCAGRSAGSRPKDSVGLFRGSDYDFINAVTAVQTIAGLGDRMAAEPIGYAVLMPEGDMRQQQTDEAGAELAWTHDDIYQDGLLVNIAQVDSDERHAQGRRTRIDNMQVLQADALVAGHKRSDVHCRVIERIVRRRHHGKAAGMSCAAGRQGKIPGYDGRAVRLQ